MDVLGQWQNTQAHLKAAISSYLLACNALHTTIVRPTKGFKSGSFENAILTVQSSIDSLDQMHLEIVQSRATINRLLNASTSRVAINKLPPETLARIFSLATLSSCYPRPKQRDSLVDILRVCTRWHQIAISDPSLWTHIDVRIKAFETEPKYPGIERARIWLDRAQGMPILIHVCDQNEYVDNNAIALLASILKPQAVAFDSLIFSGTYARKVMQAVFSLCSSHNTNNPIRNLSVSEIYSFGANNIISWPTKSFHGLVNLSLDNLAVILCPSMAEVVSMLSNSPCLRTLRLRCVTILSDQNQNISTISLPCLQLLDITNLEQANISALLPILFPGTLELDVRLGLCDGEDAALATESFLKRSNVAHLTINNIYDEYDSQLNAYLSAVPNVRVLNVGVSGDQSRYILDAIAPLSGNQVSCRLPDLHSLGLFSGRIEQVDTGHLERVVRAYSLRRVVFAGCTFPYQDLNQEEEYQGDEDHDHRERSREMPESLMKWLSDRVGSVVIDKELDIDSIEDMDAFMTKFFRTC